MIGHVRHKVETFVRGQPVDPTIAAITMVMTHNSLARTHGFPLCNGLWDETGAQEIDY